MAPEQRALRLAVQILESVQVQRAAGRLIERAGLDLAVAFAAEQRRRRIGAQACGHHHEETAWRARALQRMQIARIGLASGSQARRPAAPAKSSMPRAAPVRASPAVTLLLPMGTARLEPWVRSDSRLRRPASSARSTVRSSLVSDSGFSTKSKAPRRVASTAVSTVPWPDIMTTGQS